MTIIFEVLDLPEPTSFTVISTSSLPQDGIALVGTSPRLLICDDITESAVADHLQAINDAWQQFATILADFKCHVRVLVQELIAPAIEIFGRSVIRAGFPTNERWYHRFNVWPQLKQINMAIITHQRLRRAQVRSNVIQHAKAKRRAYLHALRANDGRC